MATVKVLKTDGTQAGEMELSETVFEAPINENVLHDVVVAHLAACRQGTQSALTRAEVRGGGIKPFRQKGTGRAREGSSRSPQYEGGGVVFAPKPRDYTMKVNRKVRQAAMRSALSSKLADGDLIVVDEIALSAPKTREVAKMLKSLEAPSALIVTGVKVPEDAEGAAAKNAAVDNVVRSAANIPGVGTAAPTALSVYDILNHDKLIVTKDAVTAIEEVFGA